MNNRVVIVGMGPGGIVAAIEAAKKGHDVLIVENRDYFTRSQRVHLDKETIDYLTSLNSRDSNASEADKALIQAVKKDQNIPVNKLQEFLERKLVNLHSDKVEVRKGSNHQVGDVNLNDNSVEITSNGKKEIVKFSNLVGADGARHEMANKVNAAAGSDNIQYNRLENQTRQEPHGTVSFRSTLEEGRPKGRSKYKLNWSAMPHLQQLGWDQPYLPQLYMFRDQDHKHFYIAGEIPARILDPTNSPERKQELMVEWGQAILKHQFGFENVEGDFQFDVSGGQDAKSKQEDNLKATAFPVTLSYTETPCFPLSNGGAFVLMGDASKNANFHLGHGANDAIRDGIKFGECLQENGGPAFDAAAYTEHVRQEKASMLEGMKKIDEGMVADYKQRITLLDEDIIKQGKVLISLAELQQGNPQLAMAAHECKKALEVTPFNYDDIYLKTINLANVLNEHSRQLQAGSTKKMEPNTSEYRDITRDMDKANAQLSTLQQKQAGKLYQTVTKLITPLGGYLEAKNNKAAQTLRTNIANLGKKKEELISQKKASQQDIVQPGMAQDHKKKLGDLIEAKKENPRDDVSAETKRLKEADNRRSLHQSYQSLQKTAQDSVSPVKASSNAHIDVEQVPSSEATPGTPRLK